jgi:hypothetical protein
MRLTEHKLVVAMARQDLKKYCMHPHVLTINNIGDPVFDVLQTAVRDSLLIYY